MGERLSPSAAKRAGGSLPIAALAQIHPYTSSTERKSAPLYQAGALISEIVTGDLLHKH